MIKDFFIQNPPVHVGLCFIRLQNKEKKSLYGKLLRRLCRLCHNITKAAAITPPHCH